MSDTVKAEVFNNRNGEKLFAITHIPSGSKQMDPAILLLSPGVKMRVAPHRMYNRMAKTFSEMGFLVVRFDFSGLGDSEGSIEEDFLADFYTTVQLGRYVNDTLDAMDWVEKHYKKKTFILAGLCGGAITGLLAGQSDPRVEALIGLGIPVILDGSNVDHSKYLTEGQLDRLRSGYFKRLLNIKSWIRFLTFQTNYSLLLKSLMRHSFKNNQVIDNKDDESVESFSNINPHFAPAYFKWIKESKNILLIFSGSDRLTWEFEEKFLEPYKSKLDTMPNSFEVYSVKQANHIFSFSEWYHEMMLFVIQWLTKRYKVDYK